jgi:hypothetical protein
MQQKYPSEERGKIVIDKVTEKDTWNQLVSRCTNVNPFCFFEYGEFKNPGWLLERLAFYKEETFVGCCQLLRRHYPALTIGWIPAGIQLVSFSDFGKALSGLENHCRGTPFNIRIHFYDLRNSYERFLILANEHVTLPITQLSGGASGAFSVRFNPTQRIPEPSDMTQRTRRNYKAAQRKGLEFIEEKDLDVEEFYRVYKEMAAGKEVFHPTFSPDLLRSLKTCMGQYAKMYSVRHQGTTVSSCILIEREGCSYYYLAASDRRGRQLCAGYYLVVQMLKRLQHRGVSCFDFGGISSRKETEGVSAFKMGFGGEVVEYQGEFDFSNSRFAKWLFNTLLSVKKRLI